MSSPGTALENVLYEKKGAIAYVTVNRPKVLNALSQRTWEDLRAAFELARTDVEVRGVILTGAGDKAFIAGADIGELARITAVEAEKSSSYGQEVLNLVENLGKPVIAAVNGFALGGGCELALACDLRIASTKARFALPEVDNGALGCASHLAKLVPPLIVDTPLARLDKEVRANVLDQLYLSGHQSIILSTNAEIDPDGELFDRVGNRLARVYTLHPHGKADSPNYEVRITNDYFGHDV